VKNISAFDCHLCAGESMRSERGAVGDRPVRAGGGDEVITKPDQYGGFNDT
jgi:hypothetical protein